MALEKMDELISGVRSINFAGQHRVDVPGDDQPCFWQRKEWIEWILSLADEAEKELTAFLKE